MPFVIMIVLERDDIIDCIALAAVVMGIVTYLILNNDDTKSKKAELLKNEKIKFK